MPTVITHAAPVLALGAGFGLRAIPARLVVAGVVCAMMPDLDVIGLRLGVPYGDHLGHRGLTHSLFFAMIPGVLGFLAAPWLKARRLTALAVLFFATASHGVLDAMTTGGLGAALLWPVSEQRYFLPWRPIRVSPFNPQAFLSQRGLDIVLSELRWVWLPCLAAAVAIRLGRAAVSRPQT